MMDGYELYRHLLAGGHPFDGVDQVNPHHAHELDELVPRFIEWFEDLISQPDGPEAFDPVRLEHRFALGTPEGAAATVLTAAEYPGGALDWHAFSYGQAGASLATAPDPAAASTVTRTVVPGEVRYSGMPNPRWWAFEDGSTDFGAVSADTTDLVKLLFLEFALVYSNDWFLLPCDVDRGTLARVEGVAVTDVFGVRTWIEPAGSGVDDDWQRWTLFTLDVAGDAPTAARLGLFLPPSATGTADGPPVEEVLMVRDEAANYVWGIERTVELATGTSQPGEEAARETLAYRRRLHPPPAALPPVASIAYEAMSSVPENWIPFVPVHVPGDNREIQLQRGAMPRVLEGLGEPPEKVRPRTTLLRPGLGAGQPYVVQEEEVPRVGTRLTVGYRRARRQDGGVVVWLGARRATGRGEAGSGLDWDGIDNTG
jgi:hypothetical protein